ncbi:YlbF family regulator [Paenibacillus sp. GCM10027626]|uniref:YlbF family regulator n=1 Tax=Paenibacillus sp. GCM10027626 TaxID=3273411 RepID=UPI00362C12FB
MAELLQRAYELGDLINRSTEVAEYSYWKAVVEEDEEVRRVKERFAKAKEAFAETERFGRYHPDYHDARKRVKAIRLELEALEPVRRYEAAEQAVDTLLFEVASNIAGSISDTIKVASNDPFPKGGGCGSGGKCSCGSGGCG